ncbi:HlyD family efflux transporter periplasmic adaptor subunit [Paenalcaligenes hominis]|uniref:Membrane fusion protein (Multidrug efflux system) n=1 Tax=Paenalcaligenes hominis TaxID=643674 RepID=A0ABX0WTJ9_9BURK|nr:HlyD family efflux transporter periplasmic adaptor subunit [Paenalcaligenes hominis]NJB66056.1 membrane fusion protein (multidrug efflux system) [Paenalcaligenes hominis]GGE71699.1 multidrug resistance protein [Paenalcaligenes hominis]
MSSTETPTHPKRKPLLRFATFFFIVIGVCYAIWWFSFAAQFESTEDAYVHGNLVPISSRVPGTVIALYADETQTVQQGDVIVQLDDTDYRLALQTAEAQLAQVVRHTQTLYTETEALKASILEAEANIEATNSELSRANQDLKRRQTLGKAGGVSGEELLHARTAQAQAQAAVTRARAAREAAQAKLKTNQALTAHTEVAQHPDVLRAAQAVRQAWLDVERTTIRAPISGVLAQRSAQLGKSINVNTPLFSVIAPEQLWVEANFKENQLTHFKPGLPVSLYSDYYGKKQRFHGVIEGISAGTGGVFSLLPPQNASGNWIKVIQRVPVRIQLDPDELAQFPLRAGLSMHAKVALDEPVQKLLPAASTPSIPLSSDTEQVEQRIHALITDNLSS